jgi:hypothetical protein
MFYLLLRDKTSINTNLRSVSYVLNGPNTKREDWIIVHQMKKADLFTLIPKNDRPLSVHKNNPWLNS